MNEVISKIKMLKTKDKFDIFMVDQCGDRTILSQGDAKGRVIINLTTSYTDSKGYQFYNKDANNVFVKEDNTLALRDGDITMREYKNPLPGTNNYHRHHTIYLHTIKEIIKATEDTLAKAEKGTCLQYLALRGEYCYACDGNMLVRLPNPLPVVTDFLVDISRLKQYVKILTAMKIKKVRAWQDKEDRLIFESVDTVYTTPKYEDAYLILDKPNLEYPDIEKLIKSDLCVSAKIEASEIHRSIDDIAKANIPKTEILGFTQSNNQLVISNTNCKTDTKFRHSPHDVSAIKSDTYLTLKVFHCYDNSFNTFNTFYINNTFYSRLKNIFPKTHVIRMDWGNGTLSPKYFYNDSVLVLIMPSQFKGQAN